MLRKNDVITAEITGYTSEGAGVCRAEDGMAVFVRDAIAGERAQIRIEHVGRTAAYARIVRLETVSPHRVQRECPVGKACGGCAFWHMDYREELRLKAQRVRDALIRIGGVDPGEVPILGGTTYLGYRNKAQYPVAPGAGRPVAGFFRAGTHSDPSVQRCLIQPEQADAAREAVLAWMPPLECAGILRARPYGTWCGIFMCARPPTAGRWYAWWAAAAYPPCGGFDGAAARRRARAFVRCSGMKTEAAAMWFWDGNFKRFWATASWRRRSADFGSGFPPARFFRSTGSRRSGCMRRALSLAGADGGRHRAGSLLRHGDHYPLRGPGRRGRPTAWRLWRRPWPMRGRMRPATALPMRSFSVRTPDRRRSGLPEKGSTRM